MTYWELEEEAWESEDNYDGARWMTNRGRVETLKRIYQMEAEDTK